MSAPDDWIVVARCVRPQGRKGEVLCDLLSDFPERFASGTSVSLSGSGTDGLDAPMVTKQIASSWLPRGKNEGRIVLGFSDVTSIEAAEQLSGTDVLIPRSERHVLQENAAYVSDLIGCTLLNGGDPVGEIRDVLFPTTADGRRQLPDAAPLLSVQTSAGAEVLVPFAKDWLVEVDTSERRVVMRLPAGLVEVEQPG